MKEQEIKLIDKQINVSIISIITIITSIILLYNQKLYLEKRKPLFNVKTSQKISLSNRLITLITLIAFLVYNYQLYDISKKEGENLENYVLQIIASILSVIAGIIVLYVVINSEPDDSISEVENPII